MTELPATKPTSHGGIIVPFDMFRLSQLAAIFAELLVSKARNILDAKLVAVRHEASRVLLLRVEGHVVGDEPAEFWRTNADLGLIASQALPHRVLLYWAQPGPAGKRREGFLVAQRGQVIGSDEASEETGGARPETGWPVQRLCEQMRLSVADLAAAFPGSPRVEISLVDASSYNDEQLLMTLIGRDAMGPDGDGEGPPAAPGRPGPAAAAGAQPRPGAATPPSRANVEEDAKRRANEAAAEAAAQRQRAEAVQSGLAYVLDELGIIALPAAGLAEPDLLRPLVVATLAGDLPGGLPRELADRLQGKRCDVGIVVEFLSEVFLDNTPLSKPAMLERASTREIAGLSLRALEVLAPRVGYGTLLSNGSRHVFISRKPDQALPDEVVTRLFGGQS
ncbi:MAG: hypothetical protein K1X88_07865 [Nannocystaceae bacterium]|nr:hypothetical protein [Nannocystaceae bacterium]